VGDVSGSTSIPSSGADLHPDPYVAIDRTALIDQAWGLAPLTRLIQEVMALRVFVAGGTGAVGRRLVPRLVARGHEVTAKTTNPDKISLLAQVGAHGLVMDGLDAGSVGDAVASAHPDVIVHQMTAISMAYAGRPDMKHMDRWFATTNRLRTEGTDNLLAAARASGVSRVVAQSYASWNGIRSGGWVKTEQDPLDLMTGTAAHAGMMAIRDIEDMVVNADGVALRYGALYGPGASDDQVELVRKRQVPLIGAGTGYSSWVHVEDAARATVLAVEQQISGVFNIVDDEPAPASEWLPHLAACAGGKPPVRLPTWLARLLAGEVAVVMMTEGRGFSNAKPSASSAGRFAILRGGRASAATSSEDGRAPKTASSSDLVVADEPDNTSAGAQHQQALATDVMTVSAR
jgi:nucleoside-diphosphate-sugar epimerase